MIHTFAASSNRCILTSLIGETDSFAPAMMQTLTVYLRTQRNCRRLGSAHHRKTRWHTSRVLNNRQPMDSAPHKMKMKHTIIVFLYFAYSSFITSLSLGFLGFRGRLLGCKRVGKSSSDGDGRSNDGVALHSLLEHNRRNNDDDDTLSRVQNRTGDSSNKSGESEGALIVEVVEESRENNVLDDRPGSVRLNGLSPDVLQSGGFVEEDKRNSANKRKDVHDTVDIGSVHVLGSIGLHGLGDGRSKLSLHGSGSVGHGGKEQSIDIDINTLSLLDTSKADTSNDRDEHHVSKRGLNVHGWHKDTNNGGKDWFASLDNLSETDGSNGSGQHRSTVSQTGEQTDREASHNVARRKIWGFADSSQPHSRTHDNTNNQLGRCNGPVSINQVCCLLVVDVVEGVSRIPQENQCTLSNTVTVPFAK